MDKDQSTNSHKLSYESLWKAIIRPPRDIYSPEDLGPIFFRVKDKTYIRKDLEIVDFQGLLLKVSIIEPDPSCRPKEIMPIVIYLHANASSRIEGLNIQKYLLKHDINLCVFDFEGSGHSEGEYISLGFHEKNQVKTIVNLLEKYKGVGNIGIWGRSMGAVTALLFASMDNRIKALVVDSPFCDFRRLAKETCLKQIKVPGFLVEGAISIIGKSVFNRNGMKINEIKAIEEVKNCKVPVIFIHALDDDLVPFNHSEELIKNYAGKDKVLKTVHGGHNGKRPTTLMEFVGNFFNRHLWDNVNENNNNNIYNSNDNIDLIIDDSQKEENEGFDDDQLIYNNFPKTRGKTIYDDLKLSNKVNNTGIKTESNENKKEKMYYGFLYVENEKNKNNSNVNNIINNNQNNNINVEGNVKRKTIYDDLNIKVKNTENEINKKK